MSKPLDLRVTWDDRRVFSVFERMHQNGIDAIDRKIDVATWRGTQLDLFRELQAALKLEPGAPPR